MRVTIIQQNQLRRDWLNVVRPFRVVRSHGHEAKASHYRIDDKNLGEKVDCALPYADLSLYTKVDNDENK